MLITLEHKVYFYAEFGVYKVRATELTILALQSCGGRGRGECVEYGGSFNAIICKATTGVESIGHCDF